MGPSSLTRLVAKYSPTWTALRTLGESNAVKLTALAPVLGSLVLVNDELSRLFHSTLLDASLPLTEATKLLGVVPVPRLHMLYLGLSFLGVGAILFSIWCPAVIKRYSSPEEWLRGEERMLGPSRLTHIFFGIIDTYWEWTSQSDRSDDPAMRDALEGYGEERDSLLHGLINDIVIELERPVEEPERPAVLMDASGERVIAPPPQTDDESHFQRFRMGMSGEINTDEYISVAFHRRMAERYMWQSLGTYAATSFKEQVVFLKYLDIQADRPWLRAATTIAYSIGALLLALPTLHTFGAIVSSAWRAA